MILFFTLLRKPYYLGKVRAMKYGMSLQWQVLEQLLPVKSCLLHARLHKKDLIVVRFIHLKCFTNVN